MTRQQLLDEMAESARKYEESNNEEIIGVTVLFEDGLRNNGFFKWKVFEYDGTTFHQVEGAVSIGYAHDV